MRLLTGMLFALCVAQAQTGEPALRIPSSKTSIDLDGQSVEITTWGTVSAIASGAFALALTVDLGGFQDALTSVLGSQLNRADRCGERLTVGHAALVPEAPSSFLTASVYYERNACANVLGKQVVKKLAGGYGVIEMKLTPEVADNNISLDAEVRKSDAEGSLGELLRSGSLGDSLRQDIGDAVESAIQKSADLNGTLPAALHNAVTIQSVHFADGGAGRLWLTIAGEVRLSAKELQRAVGQW
jgi:hypothetical protein